MNEKTSLSNEQISNEEIEIIELFRRIPKENRNEALINMYVIAENSHDSSDM